MQASPAGNSMPHETSSLSYIPNGSTNDPSKPHGLSLIHRVSDTPWAYQRDVTLDFSRPGKPTDNAYIKAFNGKFRAECLNAHWFMGLEDTAEKLEAWRRDYNEERPHSAIGNKVPAALMKLPDASSPSA